MQVFKFFQTKAGKNTVFFLLLFALIVGASGQITYASMQNDDLLQSRNKSLIQIQKEPKNSIDVIVVGDSLSYSAISPMQLWETYGISSYVCGQYGQKIQETYTMLETAFAHQKPSLVIMETNPMFRVRGRTEEVKSTLEEQANRYFPVFRYHNIWKSYLFGPQYCEQDYKGFIVRSEVQPYAGGDTYMQPTEEVAPINDLILAYMQKIKTLCEENGAQLILVSVPSPYNYNYKRHNAIATYAAQQDLTYVDMNLATEEIGIDWETDCRDNGDHLNLNGAQKVSAYLGNYLHIYGGLKDHRGEDAYKSWEQEAKAYDRMLEQQAK